MISSEKTTILIVEDSEIQRVKLQKLLETQGWNVIGVANGRETLEIVREHGDHISLIVVDYLLPDITGDDLCRKIKSNINTRNIPILILTILDDAITEANVLESGADDYLPKKADSDICIMKIKTLINKAVCTYVDIGKNEIFISRNRLLVVDDSPTYLMMLVESLKMDTYDVDSARSGEEALEVLKEKKYDCILIDLIMPGMNGIALCQKIIEIHKDSPSMPLMLILTGYEDKDVVTQAFSIGADDFVCKSSDISVIRARIKALLRRKFFQEENRMLMDTLKEKNLELSHKNELLENKESLLKELVDKKTKRIQDLTVGLVSALETVNQYNDSETGNHIKRVSKYSALIAGLYGCKSDYVKKIELYASLHDIGKVGISDSLLKKTGRYDEEERAKMNQHVAIGSGMLDTMDLDPMAKNIVKYHHERWDGKGYLQQLSGDDIPLEARIVSVADVFDALVSKRVYKDSMPFEKALSILEEEAGSHFDPELVEVFLNNKGKVREIMEKY